MKRAIILFVPWTRHFVPKIKNFDELKAEGVKFYVDAVEYHKKTFQEDSPRFDNIFFKIKKKYDALIRYSFY